MGIQETARKPTFPEDFQWGVATSAFQLEGSPNADWSTWDPVLSDIPEITNHYTVFRRTSSS
jgi:beta-glucosidase